MESCIWIPKSFVLQFTFVWYKYFCLPHLPVYSGHWTISTAYTETSLSSVYLILLYVTMVHKGWCLWTMWWLRGRIGWFMLSLCILFGCSGISSFQVRHFSVRHFSGFMFGGHYNRLVPFAWEDEMRLVGISTICFAPENRHESFSLLSLHCAIIACSSPKHPTSTTTNSTSIGPRRSSTHPVSPILIHSSESIRSKRGIFEVKTCTSSHPQIEQHISSGIHARTSSPVLVSADSSYCI